MPAHSCPWPPWSLPHPHPRASRSRGLYPAILTSRRVDIWMSPSDLFELNRWPNRLYVTNFPGECKGQACSACGLCLRSHRLAPAPISSSQLQTRATIASSEMMQSRLPSLSCRAVLAQGLGPFMYRSLRDVPRLISVLSGREQDGNACKEQHTHGKQCQHERESDAALLGRACQCWYGAGASAGRRLR